MTLTVPIEGTPLPSVTRTPLFAVANPDLPNDSLYPTLGFQLRIPSNIAQILNDFEQLNN